MGRGRMGVVGAETFVMGGVARDGGVGAFGRDGEGVERVDVVVAVEVVVVLNGTIRF